READGPARVRPDRRVAEARGGGGGSAARRGADPELVVPRVERGPQVGVVGRQGGLGHLRLADDDGARRPEACDDRAVRGGDVLGQGDRACGRGRPLDPAQVLDGDGDAVQRAARTTVRELLGQSLRLGHRLVGQDHRVGVQGRVVLLDPLERRRRGLDRAQPAVADPCRELVSLQEVHPSSSPVARYPRSYRMYPVPVDGEGFSMVQDQGVGAAGAVGVTAPAPRPVVAMRAVRKSYVSNDVLRDSTVHIHAGQVLALAGENGAGKSTLMKILAGLVVPDHGSVTVDGAELAHGSVLAARRAGIAIVPQELAPVPDMTVAQNIFLGREPRTRYGTIDSG